MNRNRGLWPNTLSTIVKGHIFSRACISDYETILDPNLKYLHGQTIWKRAEYEHTNILHRTTSPADLHLCLWYSAITMAWSWIETQHSGTTLNRKEQDSLVRRVLELTALKV